MAITLVDHSSKDGTGDAINGSEVDENPNTLNNVLNGVTSTTLNNASPYGMNIYVPVLVDTSTAAGGIRTAVKVRHDPSSGTVTAVDGPAVLLEADDSAGNVTSLARVAGEWVTVTDGGTEAANLLIHARIANALVEVATFGTDGFILNEAGTDLDYRFETDTNANAFTIDAGLFSGVGGIGLAAAATTAAAVLLDNPAFTAAANTNIAKLRIENSAAITVPAGTTTIAASVSIDEPNLTATGTITNAVTLYVEAAPTEGGTTNYALWVDAGVSAFGGNLVPDTSDGAALGTTSLMFSDLFLASGAVINFNAGNYTLTHSAGLLTASGGLTVSGAFTATSGTITGITDLVVADGGTGVSTLAANGVLYGNGTGVVLVTAQGGANTILTANAGAPSFSAAPTIGTSVTTPILYITSGGKIDFLAGDITITPTANTLTVAGASSGYIFDAVIKPSANDGFALGVSGTAFSDLFLATGAVIDFGAGDVTITHSSNLLAFAGAATAYTFDTNVGIGTSAPDNILHLWKASAGVVAAATEGTLVIEGSAAVGINFLTPNNISQYVIFGDADDNNVGYIEYAHASDSLNFYTATGLRMSLNNAGAVFIGDTSNANMTQGLTINQASADDEILSVKSSDVAHGVTGLTETDTYGFVRKLVGAGGLEFYGLMGTGIANRGVTINGLTVDAADTTHTASGNGLVSVNGVIKSGVNTAAPGANGNLFAVTSAGNARFIVDQEGDLFADGSDVTVYDEYDDVALLSAFDKMMFDSGGRGLIQKDFEDFTKYNEQTLIDLDILGGPRVGVDPSQRGLINYTGLARLHNGAIRQLAQRVTKALTMLEAHTGLRLLEA